MTIPVDKKFPFDFMECVEVEPNGRFLRIGSSLFTQKLAYGVSGGANGQPEYIGITTPGTGISASAWSIKRLSYDSDGNVTDVKWASASIAFSRMWDDRSTYTYS